MYEMCALSNDDSFCTILFPGILRIIAPSKHPSTFFSIFFGCQISFPAFFKFLKIPCFYARFNSPFKKFQSSKKIITWIENKYENGEQTIES